MVRKYTGNTRVKKFYLEQTEVDGARLAAARTHDGSVSALGRSIIRDFLDKGSDFVDPELDLIQVSIEPEVLNRAEEKARAEYGVGIKEILRHELAKHAKRARRARR